MSVTRNSPLESPCACSLVYGLLINYEIQPHKSGCNILGGYAIVYSRGIDFAFAIFLVDFFINIFQAPAIPPGT